MRRKRALWFVVLWIGAVGGIPVHAQDDRSAAPATEAAPDREAGQDESIASAQLGLAMRYQRFESSMLQVAEYLRKTDPERAELLVRAIGKSKETRLPDQFEQLVNLLKQEQLGDAVQEQEHVVVLLEGLLELLQSEDRKDDIEKEKQRVKDLIKDVDRLIDRQTDVRSRTERRENPQGLEQAQKKLAGDAQRLVKKIDDQDRAKNGAEAKPQPAESNSEKPPSDKDADSETQPPSTDKDEDSKDQKQSGEQKNGDQKNGEQKPSDKPENSKPSPGKSGSPMPPQPGQPSPSPEQDEEQSAGKPQPAEKQQKQQKQNKTQGRDEIERAKEEMERAIEELNKKNHGRASDEQDQALSELIKAKNKLEDILRQLREEEREMLLAALEARLRDMLARQLAVYNSTVGLNAIPEDQRTDRHRNQSVALARAQEAISLLAAKALTILKEEGSSIAFPEAVEEMRDDMLTVVQRLERFDVAELTQGIERDIMESLEELIQALQKEMEKGKNKEQGSSESGEQRDQALVDQLAELKTLRALQFRVNRRTKVLGREVDGEQAVDPDVRKQLHILAKRQEKIQRATYDLSTGRNR